MADRYDTMTKAQLEDDAAGRTPPVDLSGAANNSKRAQLLRDADTADAAAADEAQPDQPVFPNDAAPSATSEDQVTAGAEEAAAEGQPVPDPAPYPDDTSQAAAQAAAAGEVHAEPSIDTGKAEDVGGKNNES